MAKFCVLIPVSNATDLKSDSRLQCLMNQGFTDWKAYFLGANGVDTSQISDSRFAAGPSGLETFAQLINWAADNGGCDYIVPLAVGINLKPGALQAFAKTFESDPKVAVTYSSYSEISGQKAENIHLFQHEGAPHERFDFGYVKVYRAEALKKIGGVRTDLEFAAEYDADLKLAETGQLVMTEGIQYDAVLSESTDDSAPGALHSPGKGKLGGFSYIFYPEKMEAEITGVFEDALRRRNAWIDHETVNVPYPEKPYEVLASVIIPILNRVTFIGNAVERVLEGTFQDFEVIIIDNGSTDGTQDEVRKYVEKDSRVRLVQREGGTIASALNTGIREARGKYICQLDSDDEYTPDTLEKMVGHMESHPKCGLAISYYELMDENRNKVEGIDPITHSGYTRNQILRRDGGGALRVFPKVVLEEMGYYDEEHFGNFGEDYDMVLKTGEKYDVDRVHHVLYRYRRHSDNTDVTRDPLMKIQNKNNARLNALARRKKINESRKG